MIGFAGPRVVKETTHSGLPPGFQTAEFMIEHGLVDMIAHRKDIRAMLAKVPGFLASKARRVHSEWNINRRPTA